MHAIRFSAVSALVVMALVGCDRLGKRQPAPSSSPVPSTSASAPPLPSASAAATVLDAPAVGEGVKEVIVLDKARCALHTFELATYLQRGELTLAARNQEVAASWLVQLRDRAQIGFAGFDAQARRVARDRGIGNAGEHAPTLFATGDSFTVAWFDNEGLAYAKPAWEAQPAPEIAHLGAVKDVAPEDLAIAAAPSGALVAASPFGTQGDQLSLFLFGIEGRPPEALGLTKGAKKPHRPSVAANDDGYAVAWVEAEGGVFATKFDRAGKETVSAKQVVVGLKWDPGNKRIRPTIVAMGQGWLLLWPDGETIVGRLLSAGLDVSGAPFVIATGRHYSAVPSGNGDVIVGYLAEALGKSDQLIAVRIEQNGVKSQGLRISDAATEVMDPPAIAAVPPRIAFAYTEIMSPIVSSKRAHLRTFSASCVP